MYWDCWFAGNLYLSGSLPSSNLPTLPLMQSVYQMETFTFETALKDAQTLVDMVKNFKDHPDGSLEYIANFPLTSGAQISQGAAKIALKGLGVSDNDAKKLAKIFVPSPPPIPVPHVVGEVIKAFCHAFHC
jgi:hypothetical protein